MKAVLCDICGQRCSVPRFVVVYKFGSRRWRTRNEVCANCIEALKEWRAEVMERETRALTRKAKEEGGR